MSIICPACGASNRASAKFCRQCASLMTLLSPETQVLERDTEMLPPPGQRKRRRRGAGSTPWLVLSIAVAALCLGLLAIWLARLGAARTPAVSATAATAQAPARAPATANTRTNTSTNTPTLAASGPAAPHPATPALNAPPTPAATASAPMAAPLPVASHPLPAVTLTVAPTPAPAPRPAARPRPRVRPAPAPDAPPPAPEPPPPPPAPVAAVPAPPPAPATPAQTCGDRRFIAHAVCMQNECNKPGMRNHPQCVRLREQQEALRRASGGG